MDDDWIKSPAARRIFIHWTDPRPAWLWSQDGTTLLWRNRAAAFFGAKLKKSGLRLAADPLPIKGQVARLIRLGSVGRSSLARLQFLAGGRPASTTASVTPLEDAQGRPIVLAVGVDAIEPEILSQPVSIDASVERALLPAGASYLIVGPDGEVNGGSPGIEERFTSVSPDADRLVVDGEERPVIRYRASQQGDQLLVLGSVAEALPEIDAIRNDEGLAALERTTEASPTDAEPLLPMGMPDPPAAPPQREWTTEAPAAAEGLRLSSLFDRLADSPALYAGLPEGLPRDAVNRRDEDTREPESTASASEAGDLGTEASRAPEIGAIDQADGARESETASPAEGTEPDVIAAVIEFEDDLASDRSSAMYRVTGRGFTPGEKGEPEEGAVAMDGESRRNFSEIGRILSGGAAPEPPAEEPAEIDSPIEPMPPASPIPSPAGDRALVNIGAETFILNRLPLGIMVFRDQQVLFANRALIDLVGYPTIDSLRAAGLSAIFPGDDPAAAGPVTQLVRRDGARVPVTARLQSVTWQGRPALMLSASGTEPRVATEASVRNFAAAVASLRDEGFITLDPTGVLVTLSDRAIELLGPKATRGRPFADLLAAEGARAIRSLLDRPARFAGTDRPMTQVEGPNGTAIALFAEGMAGIVTGYLGLVAAAEAEAPVHDLPGRHDPAMLARISRGVRRPLNTIVGFADLIRSAAFGTIENHRYLEYARDIRTAGQEIAVLIDELDDYARLNAGTYPVRPADLDLSGLLDSCVVRVRGQANAARVLVRSAISEDLPHIRADRASLGQAVLNLLASAIDQTPANGSVILSAQRDEGGGIVINVRDSGEANADPGERFVVFRDGVGKDETLAPVRSSVGLALTRSLVAVNTCALTVTPAGAVGTIFSLTIPPDLVGPAAA